MPRRLVPALALTLGIAGGLLATGAFAGEPELSPPPGQYEYEVNEDGETFGSAVNALTPEQEPDLIEAIATNGKTGYVRRIDLEEPIPENPEEAVRMNTSRTRSIPVYLEDGKTVIGEFIIQ